MIKVQKLPQSNQLNFGFRILVLKKEKPVRLSCGCDATQTTIAIQIGYGKKVFDDRYTWGNYK